ncbi:NfeD family protein [Trichlorobacter ammonificans]|uniref:Activity regulator of membrane protease YbbK n=1 Tax=Trichlorobacter ammonificans TaxID=2916410 RepID=A0ABM9DCF9_9BACT|nr:NfeD family protein [Trichlorobacter ammonificans]CAH2032122.1 Putative activity regulator of membrane protease YbbK [Trichlorobacter ammonificans]
MKLEWWYWMVAGLLMIGLELVIPSFTIIWFGLGALVVGLLLFLLPELPAWLQVLLWALASVGFTVLWFRYLRDRGDRTHAGLSKEGIVGESGMVIRGTDDSYQKGTVRFRISILGADEWTCYAEEPLKVGDTVQVIDIEGQILKVKKL